jgi:hypothetical protein
MTKRTMVAGALLGLALLGSLVTTAHAGGGGFGGGPLDKVFLTDCYQVTPSVNIPYTLELVDQYGDHQNVKVGQAAMFCAASTTWSRQAGVNQPPLNPDFNQENINAVKCYQVAAPGDQGPGPVGTVTDIFTTQTTNLNRLSMVCVPATIQ